MSIMVQEGIIEKYLKLYQVLEELMVRVNVVKFSKETISVRSLEEFKSIKSSEREALKRLLFKYFMRMPYLVLKYQIKNY